MTGPQTRPSRRGNFPLRPFRARSQVKLLSAVLFALLISGRVPSAAERAITVEDCVRTRRVLGGEVKLSPDGSGVAYIVKAPDVDTDRNEYRLYIRWLSAPQDRRNGTLLLEADVLSDLAWLGDRILIVRVSGEPASASGFTDGIYEVNVNNGSRKRLDLPPVAQLSVAADGKELVFATAAPEDADSALESKQRTIGRERGYEVGFGDGDASTMEHLPEQALYAVPVNGNAIGAPRRLVIHVSWKRRTISSLRNIIWLDLSPDGKQLLLVYSAKRLPPGWESEPYVQAARGLGTYFETYVLGLYDLGSGNLRLGFNFPAALIRTRWSADAQTYCVISPRPFGGDDAGAEHWELSTAGDLLDSTLRLQQRFVVNARTLRYEKLFSGDGDLGRKSADDLPLSWKHAHGPMLVRGAEDDFCWMAYSHTGWRVSSEFSFWEGQRALSSLASNGQMLAGISQSTMVPPDLFVFGLRTRQPHLLTDLNPEYRDIRLGKVQPFAWTNRYGSQCSGLLVEPVGYRPGRRYPMIFMAAPPQGVFISDAPYTTAFAPQPLAAAGFVVLISQYPTDNAVPRGKYPGQMADAYNWMAMVESAIDLLVSRGVVDPAKVGISGFSRTSWLVDFTLTHSTYPFAAASSADSSIYTFGSYFEHNSAQEMEAEETQYGGPPYGASWSTWLEYAPPFNTARVTAPVLMEYTKTDASGLEFFTALRRLGKVAEFYRYPKGAHPLDTPYERVASLQRNVDWFRFWIEGREERSPSYDPEQYARWRELRAEQQWIERTRARGENPVAEFLRETSLHDIKGVTDRAPFASRFAN